MAAGDWGTGSFIVIERGELPEVSAGRSNVASIHYYVVLPSGARVPNGGATAPFRYSADPTLSIQLGGLFLVIALAAAEGVPVHLSDRSVVLPDGTLIPTPTSYADSPGRFNLSL